jgi:glyoxylase-like metal-dependent hydrolase (beta-lactamase superfamily II)
MAPLTLPLLQISMPTPWPAVGPVHAYLVRQDPITLIDTGLHDEASRAALVDGLARHGLTLRDIKRVLLTHAHIDHYGQAGWVAAEAGARVWLHPDEAAKLSTPDWWLEGRRQVLTDAGVPAESQALMHEVWQRGRSTQTFPLTEWELLAPGQRFEFESGVLEAVHLPGHALGHTGYWEAATGTLVGGDHLLVGVTPNPVMEPVPAGHPAAAPHAPGRALTLGQFRGALDRVAAMPVQRVLPGHGEVITDHRTVVRGYQERHERRLGRMWERLQEPVTPYALCRELYPRVREWDIFLALSEVAAHLDLLVARGRAVVEPGAEGWRYRAV